MGGENSAPNILIVDTDNSTNLDIFTNGTPQVRPGTQWYNDMYSGITLTLTSDTILSGSDTNISGSVVDIAANSLYDGGNELTINRNITSMQLDNVFDQTPLTIYGTGTIDVNEFTYGTSNRLMIDELNSTNADTILQLTTDVENYLLEECGHLKMA